MAEDNSVQKRVARFLTAPIILHRSAAQGRAGRELEEAQSENRNAAIAGGVGIVVLDIILPIPGGATMVTMALQAAAAAYGASAVHAQSKIKKGGPNGPS